MAELSEFELIERYFSPLGLSQNNHVAQSIGDDCGVIQTPPGMSLCFSIDTMVEGVHFPKGAPPFKLGYRALAAALSDLAAMGAQPFFFTLALTMPSADPDWLAEFSAGMKVLVGKHHFPLLGGDTTRGPLSISIQVHGLLSEPALLRSGAKPGDVIAVSGSLGDAGAALDFLCNDEGTLDDAKRYLLSRYYSPTPRIELGQALIGKATACIDISDGLMAELQHISRASKVKLELDVDSLPLSESLVTYKGLQAAKEGALTAGDDYELLFTMPEHECLELVSQFPEEGITIIGKVSSGSGVHLMGFHKDLANMGYQHFD